MNADALVTGFASLLYIAPFLAAFGLLSFLAERWEARNPPRNRRIRHD